MEVCEITSWLEVILGESTSNFSLKSYKRLSTQNGYMGDIYFVSLSHKFSGEYNFVLKCSPKSSVVREKVPLKTAFANEIHFYNTILPTFTQFQLEKGVEVFDSTPKFYGFRSEIPEVIVLENLIRSGYFMWNKKKPLTREHINLVIYEYSKFHAVSLAMKQENPKQFENLCSGIDGLLKELAEVIDCPALFENLINEVYNLLKNELDNETLSKWLKLKNYVQYITDDNQDVNSFKVLVHGDAWNNNYMFQYAVNGKPKKVAILDWQLLRHSSPVTDLCHFILTSISENDIGSVNEILEFYFKNLSNFSEELEFQLGRVYSFELLLRDWKKYCHQSLLKTTFILKVCYSDPEEIRDVAKTVEGGENFGDVFEFSIKNQADFKKRLKYFVKYVVENELIV